MEILAAINWEQLGASGVVVVLLAWLYKNEREERREWQNKAFDGIESYAEKLQKAVATLDSAMRMLKP